MRHEQKTSLDCYLDGMTSQKRNVTLSMEDHSFIILSNDSSLATLATWSYPKIFVKEDWTDGLGGTFGYKDSPDASLIIYQKKLFERIRKRLRQRHQASFIIPVHYRHLLLMTICAVGVGFILFPAIRYISNWVTYLVPKSFETRLSDLLIEELKTEFKPCNDPKALADLQKITKRLSDATGIKDTVPEIYLFHSTSPNAFSLPGNRIAILSGFLNDSTSENEIAGVMAHEMGHMVKRDSLQAFIESQGIRVIIGLISSSNSYGDLAEFASFMQTMDYSRQKEFAADAYGASLLVKAGYSPEGLSSFLSKIDKEAQSNFLGSYSKYLEFLSTHPDTKERIKRIQMYAQKSRITSTNSLTKDQFLELKNACLSLPKR